tara:strand:- start:117 stop:293 length:177 start_codon:yes stop_codon:yes gene_type:complete
MNRPIKKLGLWFKLPDFEKISAERSLLLNIANYTKIASIWLIAIKIAPNMVSSIEKRN